MSQTNIHDKSHKEYTKEQKLQIIQEVMSDKTLSFGCIIKPKSFWKSFYLQTTWDWDLWYDIFVLWEKINEWFFEFTKQIDNIEIIWHPVMIWDVLDWIKQITIHYDEILSLLELREHKRKPIEYQSEECISFIYNLIKDDTTN